MRRLLAAGLTLGILLWVSALLLAPVGLAGGALPAALFYQAAGLICHQLPERSFSLAGVQMPVCARCFGLYGSGAIGALIVWLGPARAIGTAASSRRLLAYAALPTLVTVAIEWLGLAYPSSPVRASAAVPLGMAVGWLLVGMLRAEAATVTLRQMRYHA